MKKYQKKTYELIDALRNVLPKKRKEVMLNCFEIIEGDLFETRQDIKKGTNVTLTMNIDDMRMMGVYLGEYRDVAKIINPNNDVLLEDVKEYKKLIQQSIKGGRK